MRSRSRRSGQRDLLMHISAEGDEQASSGLAYARQLTLAGGSRIRTFVPFGVSAAPSWRSRAQKPHSTSEEGFSVAGPRVRIRFAPAVSAVRT